MRPNKEKPHRFACKSTGHSWCLMRFSEMCSLQKLIHLSNAFYPSQVSRGLKRLIYFHSSEIRKFIRKYYRQVQTKMIIVRMGSIGQIFSKNRI